MRGKFMADNDLWMTMIFGKMASSVVPRVRSLIPMLINEFATVASYLMFIIYRCVILWA